MVSPAIGADGIRKNRKWSLRRDVWQDIIDDLTQPIGGGPSVLDQYHDDYTNKLKEHIRLKHMANRAHRLTGVFDKGEKKLAKQATLGKISDASLGNLYTTNEKHETDKASLIATAKTSILSTTLSRSAVSVTRFKRIDFMSELENALDEGKYGKARRLIKQQRAGILGPRKFASSLKVLFSGNGFSDLKSDLKTLSTMVDEHEKISKTQKDTEKDIKAVEKVTGAQIHKALKHYTSLHNCTRLLEIDPATGGAKHPEVSALAATNPAIKFILDVNETGVTSTRQVTKALRVANKAALAAGSPPVTMESLKQGFKDIESTVNTKKASAKADLTAADKKYHECQAFVKGAKTVLKKETRQLDDLRQALRRHTSMTDAEMTDMLDDMTARESRWLDPAKMAQIQSGKVKLENISTFSAGTTTNPVGHLTIGSAFNKWVKDPLQAKVSSGLHRVTNRHLITP